MGRNFVHIFCLLAIAAMVLIRLLGEERMSREEAHSVRLLREATVVPEPIMMNAPAPRPEYYSCEWHTNAPEPCLKDTECPSNVRNEEACAAACDNVDACNVYLFNKYNNCYLRAQRGDLFDDDAAHQTRLCKLDRVARALSSPRGKVLPTEAERRRKRRMMQLAEVPRPRRRELARDLALPGSMPTVELVLSRYEEDVSWVADVARELPMVSIDLYEKSPHVASACAGVLLNVTSATCTRLPNVGREAHTYLYHITSRYGQLSEKVVFAQAAAPGIGWENQLGGGHVVGGTDFFADYLSPRAPPWIVLSGWTSFTGSFMATPRAFTLPRGSRPESCPELGRDGWDVVNEGRDPFLFFTPLLHTSRTGAARAAAYACQLLEDVS